MIRRPLNSSILRLKGTPAQTAPVLPQLLLSEAERTDTPFSLFSLLVLSSVSALALLSQASPSSASMVVEVKGRMRMVVLLVVRVWWLSALHLSSKTPIQTAPLYNNPSQFGCNGKHI